MYSRRDHAFVRFRQGVNEHHRGVQRALGRAAAEHGRRPARHGRAINHVVLVGSFRAVKEAAVVCREARKELVRHRLPIEAADDDRDGLFRALQRLHDGQFDPGNELYAPTQVLSRHALPPRRIAGHNNDGPRLTPLHQNKLPRLRLYVVGSRNDVVQPARDDLRHGLRRKRAT